MYLIVVFFFAQHSLVQFFKKQNKNTNSDALSQMQAKILSKKRRFLKTYFYSKFSFCSCFIEHTSSFKKKSHFLSV